MHLSVRMTCQIYTRFWTQSPALLKEMERKSRRKGEGRGKGKWRKTFSWGKDGERQEEMDKADEEPQEELW